MASLNSPMFDMTTALAVQSHFSPIDNCSDPFGIELAANLADFLIRAKAPRILLPYSKHSRAAEVLQECEKSIEKDIARRRSKEAIEENLIGGTEVGGRHAGPQIEREHPIQAPEGRENTEEKPGASRIRVRDLLDLDSTLLSDAPIVADINNAISEWGEIGSNSLLVEPIFTSRFYQLEGGTLEEAFLHFENFARQHWLAHGFLSKYMEMHNRTPLRLGRMTRIDPQKSIASVETTHDLSELLAKREIDKRVLRIAADFGIDRRSVVNLFDTVLRFSIYQERAASERYLRHKLRTAFGFGGVSHEALPRDGCLDFVPIFELELKYAKLSKEQYFRQIGLIRSALDFYKLNEVKKVEDIDIKTLEAFCERAKLTRYLTKDGFKALLAAVLSPPIAVGGAYLELKLKPEYFGPVGLAIGAMITFQALKGLLRSPMESVTRIPLDRFINKPRPAPAFTKHFAWSWEYPLVKQAQQAARSATTDEHK